MAVQYNLFTIKVTTITATNEIPTLTSPVENVSVKAEYQLQGTTLYGFALTDNSGEASFNINLNDTITATVSRLGFITQTVELRPNVVTKVNLVTNGEIASQDRISEIFTDYYSYAPQSDTTGNDTYRCIIDDAENGNDLISNNFKTYTYPGHPYMYYENRILRTSDILYKQSSSNVNPFYIESGGTLSTHITPIESTYSLPFIIFLRTASEYGYHHILKNQKQVSELTSSSYPVITSGDYDNSHMISNIDNDALDTETSNWKYVWEQFLSNPISFLVHVINDYQFPIRDTSSSPYINGVTTVFVGAKTDYEALRQATNNPFVALCPMCSGCVHMEVTANNQTYKGVPPSVALIQLPVSGNFTNLLEVVHPGYGWNYYVNWETNNIAVGICHNHHSRSYSQPQGITTISVGGYCHSNFRMNINGLDFSDITIKTLMSGGTGTYNYIDIDDITV